MKYSIKSEFTTTASTRSDYRTDTIRFDIVDSTTNEPIRRTMFGDIEYKSVPFEKLMQNAMIGQSKHNSVSGGSFRFKDPEEVEIFALGLLRAAALLRSANHNREVYANS